MGSPYGLLQSFLEYSRNFWHFIQLFHQDISWINIKKTPIQIAIVSFTFSKEIYSTNLYRDGS